MVDIAERITQRRVLLLPFLIEQSDDMYKQMEANTGGRGDGGGSDLA